MSEFNINEEAQSGGEYSGSQSSNELESGASQPTESAFPDEDEDTITMVELIEVQDKLEEEASAVLGNSDMKNCTYTKGYISRQALYSCATCFDGTDNVAAICLACSLECHKNHDMFELYTKRNYRCDCGNSKFKSDFECKFMDKQTQKAPLNENNKYNHNFSGRYCTCNKRYPPEEGDDSAESKDEMLQCIVCEDWYHTKHLGATDMPTKFEELICKSCVDELDFVHYYRDVEASSESTDEPSGLKSGEHTELSDDKESSEIDSKTSAPKSEPEAVVTAVCESDTNDSQLENKAPNQDSINPLIKTECLLEKLKKSYQEEETSEEAVNKLSKGPMFWQDCSWRAKLCRCPDCMTMYKEKNCEYLLDDKDTVQYYEAQGKATENGSESTFERGMSALNGMNRVAVAEAINGYHELKTDLSNYLRKFATTKKVVREEDIHEFFTQLKSKKRPRMEDC